MFSFHILHMNHCPTYLRRVCSRIGFNVKQYGFCSTPSTQRTTTCDTQDIFHFSVQNIVLLLFSSFALRTVQGLNGRCGGNEEERKRWPLFHRGQFFVKYNITKSTPNHGQRGTSRTIPSSFPHHGWRVSRSIFIYIDLY